MASEEQIKAERVELEKTFSPGNFLKAVGGALFLYLIPYVGVELALPNHPLVALIVSVMSLAVSITAA